MRTYSGDACHYIGHWLSGSFSPKWPRWSNIFSVNSVTAHHSFPWPSLSFLLVNPPKNGIHVWEDLLALVQPEFKQIARRSMPTTNCWSFCLGLISTSEFHHIDCISTSWTWYLYEYCVSFIIGIFPAVLIWASSTVSFIVNPGSIVYILQDLVHQRHPSSPWSLNQGAFLFPLANWRLYQ